MALKLEKASAFFFGDVSGIDEVVERSGMSEPQTPCWHVPYDLTLVEWRQKKEIAIPVITYGTEDKKKDELKAENMERLDTTLLMPKHAMLIETSEEEKRQVYYKFTYSDPIDKNLLQPGWGVDVVAYLFEDGVWKPHNWSGTKMFDAAVNVPESMQDIPHKEVKDYVITAQLFIEILNCPNIVTKTVAANEKMNRKRTAAGRPPFYSYKVLEITDRLVKGGEKDAGTEPWGYQNTHENAFHLCRGHLKRYTEEKPLFGKYAGTFWWRPQARGSRNKGIADKDYAVKIKGEG